MISGQYGVMGNVAAGEVLSGTPAIPHHTRLKSAAAFSPLPEMRTSLNRLGVRMSRVEEGLESAWNTVLGVAGITL